MILFFLAATKRISGGCFPCIGRSGDCFSKIEPLQRSSLWTVALVWFSKELDVVSNDQLLIESDGVLWSPMEFDGVRDEVQPDGVWLSLLNSKSSDKPDFDMLRKPPDRHLMNRRIGRTQMGAAAPNVSGSCRPAIGSRESRLEIGYQVDQCELISRHISGN